MKTKILSTSEYDIALAGEILAKGGLVAFPTETVYGLGADALNEEAVKKIYAAKGRPGDNPLIVHISEREEIIPLVKKVTPKAKALTEAFFPGPLTVILPKSEKVGNVVSGGLDTVAVRMPENETARRLIKAAGCPVAAPSANTSGAERLMQSSTAETASSAWSQRSSRLREIRPPYCAPAPLQRK